MKNLAIIPARSGSKGLKDKNIKKLCGKPLMAYTIETAIKSKKYDMIHLSTDSYKYANIAKEYGADVPFLRKAELANDTSVIWDTVRDVLDEYEKIGKKFDTVTLLQPTSPLREIDDIIQSFQVFEKKNAEAVVSVCEMEHSPLICNQLDETGSMRDFIKKEIVSLPRQNLPKYYRINGAIYLLKIDVLKKYSTLYDSEVYAYIMKQETSIDIDNILDFKIAEQMMKNFCTIKRENV